MNNPNNGDFVAWLAANAQNIKDGAASYEGTRVTGESLTVRYFTCLSFVFFTSRATSPFLLEGSDAAKRTAVTATLLTLLLGWWGIPFGIIFTPMYLAKNILGGEKCTVAELIGLLENPQALQKKKDAFRYAPMVFLLAALGVIVALMIAMQSYLWLTKGTSNNQQPRRRSSQSDQRTQARDSRSRAAIPSTGDPVVDYMHNIERSLKQAWYPPKSNASSKVVVRFDINDKGQAKHARIEKSSNDIAMDAAALDAVKSAQPFPPLPAILHGKAPIEFTFDYNVWDRQHRKVRSADADADGNSNATSDDH